MSKDDMRKWRLNRRWILWAAVGAAALLAALAPWPAWQAAPQARHFRIEASQYAYTPGEIRVNPGDTVTLQLVSTDVVHGLYLDSYELSVQADPGQSKTLTFVADQPGSFRFRCNVTCGALHPFMIGRLRVGGDWFFSRSAVLAILAVFAVLASFNFSKPVKAVAVK